MSYNPILRLGKGDLTKLRTAISHLNQARILVAEVWDQDHMPQTEKEMAAMIDHLDEARTGIHQLVHEHTV